MNTEAIVHPKLLHYGLITANLEAMTDWYRNVLGMTHNHRSKIPAIARLTRQGPPFSRFAFVSNDEGDHRIVFFEIPGATVDPEKRRHTGLQHVAFEYANLDDLLGTYVRLKGLGILPMWAAENTGDRAGHDCPVDIYTYEAYDIRLLRRALNPKRG